MRDYLRNHEDGLAHTEHWWPIVAYSQFDLDGAVELMLEKKEEWPDWNGTDLTAASHITCRELLLHPDMQAFYVAEGKWMSFLSARIPEYAQLRESANPAVPGTN